jgi:hypothetical protein
VKRKLDKIDREGEGTGGVKRSKNGAGKAASVKLGGENEGGKVGGQGSKPVVARKKSGGTGGVAGARKGHRVPKVVFENGKRTVVRDVDVAKRGRPAGAAKKAGRNAVNGGPSKKQAPDASINGGSSAAAANAGGGMVGRVIESFRSGFKLQGKQALVNPKPETRNSKPETRNPRLGSVRCSQ